MEPAIRVAIDTDIESVLRLWVASGSRPTVTDTYEGLRLLLERDAGALLLAEHEGAPVGSLIAAWDGWRGSFYRLAVHPDHRRQGVASALVREGERRLGERGATRLTAIVEDDSPQGLSFWAAAGYERQAKRARFVRHMGASG